MAYRVKSHRSHISTRIARARGWSRPTRIKIKGKSVKRSEDEKRQPSSQS